jgi:hypothetical protein
VQLLPERDILTHASQLALLRRMSPGQLLGLALSLQPYLLADNVRFGYDPGADAMGEIVKRAGELGIERLFLRTNLLGVSPSLSCIRDLKTLVLEDAGIWDRGDATPYSTHISPQHRVLSKLLHNSAATLERLVLGHQVHSRPRDYGQINSEALLSQEDLSFPNLNKLEVRGCSIAPPSLKTLLEAHPNINTLMYYPERSLQLPELPDTLNHLYTNSNLPAVESAIPRDIKALFVTGAGPLLPTPEQAFSPGLPGSVSALHARLPHGVAKKQIWRLLSSMPLLEDVEIVVITHFPLLGINPSTCRHVDLLHLSLSASSLLTVCIFRVFVCFSGIVSLSVSLELLVPLAIACTTSCKHASYPSFQTGPASALARLRLRTCKRCARWKEDVREGLDAANARFKFQAERMVQGA